MIHSCRQLQFMGSLYKHPHMEWTLWLNARVLYACVPNVFTRNRKRCETVYSQWWPKNSHYSECLWGKSFYLVCILWEKPNCVLEIMFSVCSIVLWGPRKSCGIQLWMTMIPDCMNVLHLTLVSRLSRFCPCTLVSCVNINRHSVCSSISVYANNHVLLGSRPIYG